MTNEISAQSDTRTALVTRSVFSGQRKLKYAFREKSYNQKDTGWRFVGDGDTQGYLNHEDNIMLIDMKTLCQMEPLIANILNMERGTELELIEDEQGKRFEEAKD